jgi:hypothetical protein
MSAATVRWELAEAVRDIRRLAPRAAVDTMALPYGIAPKDRRLWPLLIRGRQGGTSYQNRCVLLASGGPARPFSHRLFDREQVPRIVPEPGGVEGWIKAFRSGETPAFVSDGRADTVTIPKASLIDLNRRRLRGARLAVIRPRGRRILDRRAIRVHWKGSGQHDGTVFAPCHNQATRRTIMPPAAGMGEGDNQR